MFQIPNPQSVVEYSAFGIFCYFIIKEVFKYFEKKNGNDLSKKIDTLVKDIDDLHHWHNKEYKDGVKIWYTQPIIRMLDDVKKDLEIIKKELENINSSKGK